MADDRCQVFSAAVDLPQWGSLNGDDPHFQFSAGDGHFDLITHFFAHHGGADRAGGEDLHDIAFVVLFTRPDKFVDLLIAADIDGDF